MRLTNILSIASLVLATIACSADEEVLNNVSNNNNTASEANNTYVSFNVKAEEAMTKASESSQVNSEAADAISNCSLILFNDVNGTSVYGIYDGLNITDNTISKNGSPFKVQVKLGKESEVYYAMVVANSNNTFANCSDLSEIQATIQNNANTLPKVSNLSPVTVKAGELNIANITLKQIAAQIRLKEFNVEFTGGKEIDVTISNVTVVNQVIKSETKVNGTPNQYAVADMGTWVNGTTIYTFANTNADNATALSFTLTYGDKTKECYIVINRPSDKNFTNNSGHNYIQSGYAYEIAVNAKLTSNSIDCNVVCHTADWNKVELKNDRININL